MFSYSAYKKYLKDPKCYDRRSEKKKKKYGMKLKLRRKFPVRISKVILLLLLPTTTYYNLLLTTIYYYYFLQVTTTYTTT
jgi:hypothetical protein